LVNKRKGDEEGEEVERGKRARNREERQGTKRKKDEEEEEQEEIRRLIEDAVNQPSKSRHLGRVEIGQVVNMVGQWVREVEDHGFEEVSFKGGWEAWDDVKGGSLPYKLVKEARNEEVKYMVDRGMWALRPVKQCWGKLGKAPVSVKWVDTNKGTSEDMLVRSRLVARDFKGADKDRDDLATNLLLTNISSEVPLFVSTHLTETGALPNFPQHCLTGLNAHIPLSTMYLTSSFLASLTSL
jgi:hypothetical protein